MSDEGTRKVSQLPQPKQEYDIKERDPEGLQLPSRRTYRVFELTVEGLSQADIAKELEISDRTVREELACYRRYREKYAPVESRREMFAELLPAARRRISHDIAQGKGMTGLTAALAVAKGTGALVDRQQIDQQQTQLTVELVAQLAHSLPQLMEIPALRRQLQPVLLEMSKSMLSQQQAHTPDSEERPGGSERGSPVSVDDSKPKPDTEV